MATSSLLLLGLVLIIVFLSGLTTIYFCHPFAEFIRSIDDPDNIRKFHKIPTPSTGGIGISIAFGIGCLVLLLFEQTLFTNLLDEFVLYFTGALTIIVLTGLTDDLRGLNSKMKFVFQLLASILLIYGLDQTYIAYHPSYAGLHWGGKILLYSVIILWIVGICNSINLVDGVDALAGSLSLTIIAGLSALVLLWALFDALFILVPLSAAIGAFLMFNRPPASIFMGDTGSLLIGFSLSVASVIIGLFAPHWMYSLSFLIIFGMPILDTILSIVRRVKGKMSPFESDNNHIHHLIQRYYKSPFMAVAIMTTISIFFCILGILLANTVNTILFFSAYGILLILGIVLVGLYSINLNKKESVLSTYILDHTRPDELLENILKQEHTTSDKVVGKAQHIEAN